MKKNSIHFIILTALSLILASCASKTPEAMPTIVEQNKEFNTYWYTGKAEVNVYDIEQARYGELRNGKAVRIFVTEDFLLNKQVKKESMTTEPSASVLKMNFLNKFPTGIYDYSMMSSVFTPVDMSRFKKTVKVSMSSQEWCGHVWSQLNLDKDQYEFTGHSYFEKEGEQEYYMDYAFLEDEIWTRMRLNPLGLPQGNIKIIPSLMHTRLLHYDAEPLNAIAGLTLKVNDDSHEFYVYTVKYENGRELQVHAHSQFPYRITYWEDSYESGFGPNKKRLTTKATLKKSVKEPYWGQNSNADEHLRQEIGL
ncbi:MAG: hypothetical protein HKN39_07275 [Flavobacteriales bacterium]|nr:hypothetical protein [Flavobacteriales bacterium]